ncbi:MAG: hypothetical protein IH584_06585 [Candidatus Aminicenantes bacterium]|nr:hypothetical protein [Candidatus Aminicenantes bacterium]
MKTIIAALTALACMFALAATAAETDVIKTGGAIGAHLGEGTPLTRTYGKPAQLLDSPSSVPGTSEVMMWRVGAGILVIETSFGAGIIKNISYVIDGSQEQKRTTLKVKEFNPASGEMTITIPGKATDSDEK